MMPDRRALLSAVRQVVPVLALFTLWELAGSIVGGDKVPGVKKVALAFTRSVLSDNIIQAQGGGTHGYLPHVVATAVNFWCGFVAGSVAGFVFAILLYQSRTALDLFDPIIEIFRALPPLILIPFTLLIVPPSNSAQIFIVGLYSSYSICIYTLNSLQNIESNYLLTADLFGSTRFQKIVKVEVPAVMPELVGALRVTAPLALGIIIVAEYLGAPAGIGRVLKFAISFSSVELILVGIMWVMAIVTITDLVMVLIFRHLLRWSSRSVQVIR